MSTLLGTWHWLTTAAHWAGTEGVPHRLLEHVALSVIAVALGCAVALPVGLVLGHVGRGGVLAVNVSNIGRAVPTFAILVLLALGPLGIGNKSTIVALTLFAIPPILTNTYVGMRGVDREAKEAATGMGMRGGQVLRKVELPLALPLIAAGIRTATVQVVATATIAALVGGGGLGRLVVDGFQRNDTPMLVAGALLVAVLAIAVELALGAVQRRLTPGRRRSPLRGAAPLDAAEPAGAATPRAREVLTRR